MSTAPTSDIYRAAPASRNGTIAAPASRGTAFRPLLLNRRKKIRGIPRRPDFALRH